METINERLAALPIILRYETPAALAKACALDPNTLRKAMQGPSKPSFDVLHAILERHKNLSSDWLLLGIGTALRNESAPTPLNDIQQTDPAAHADMPRSLPREVQIPGDSPFTRVSRGGPLVDPLVDQLLQRIAEQAKTIERLWGQNDRLLERGKTSASSNAADLYELTNQIQAEYASLELPDFQRYVPRKPCVKRQMNIGFGRQVG